MVKTLKNLLLQKQLTDDLETWYVALSMWVLPKLLKLWPWVDLDLFYVKVKFGYIGFCWVSIKGQGHSLTLVKGHSDFKVKCLTFGPYAQVSDSGPHGPLVFFVETVEKYTEILFFRILLYLKLKT